MRRTINGRGHLLFKELLKVRRLNTQRPSLEKKNDNNNNNFATVSTRERVLKLRRGLFSLIYIIKY